MQAVPGAMPGGEGEIGAGEGGEIVREVAAVTRDRLDRGEEGGEVVLQGGIEDAAFAAEVMVEGRFGDADRIDELLDPHGFVAARGEEAGGGGADTGAVVGGVGRWHRPSLLAIGVSVPIGIGGVKGVRMA